MGQVIVTFGKALTRDTDGSAPLLDANAAVSEELDSSGVSAPTTITARARDAAKVVNNSGGLIWVKFGAAPTAAVEDLHAIMDGTTEWFGGLGDGSKCAVIDDS